MASSKKNTDIMKKDLYKLFDIAENATTKQVKIMFFNFSYTYINLDNLNNLKP